RTTSTAERSPSLSARARPSAVQLVSTGGSGRRIWAPVRHTSRSRASAVGRVCKLCGLRGPRWLDRREEHCTQRGRTHGYGVRAPVPALRLCVHATHIAPATATIDLRVTVQRLHPTSGARYPQPVGFTRHRREIEGTEHVSIAGRAEERRH